MGFRIAFLVVALFLAAGQASTQDKESIVESDLNRNDAVKSGQSDPLFVPHPDPYIEHGRLMVRALYGNDIPRVRLLLRNFYIDPDGYAEQDGTFVAFLDTASERSTTQVLELLIDAGATASLSLCGSGADEMKRSLWFALAGRGGGSGRLPMSERMQRGQLLLSNGVASLPAMLAWKNCEARQPDLFIALEGTMPNCVGMNSDLFSFLLANGADAQARTHNNNTLFHAIAIRSNAATCFPATLEGHFRELIARGVDVNARNSAGLRAIDMVYLRPSGQGSDMSVCVSQAPTANGVVLEGLLRRLGSQPARTVFPSCPPGTACIPCKGL